MQDSVITVPLKCNALARVECEALDCGKQSENKL